MVMEEWANNVLRGTLIGKTIDILLGFADQVFLRAPVEFEILRNSTSLKLLDDDIPVYLQPAIMPRLGEAELKALRAAQGSATTPVLRKLAQI